MLFFGGFGSMIPYLIYLSIVWICVLVGIRGNITNLFRQSTDSELVIEENSQKDFIDENTLAPFSENYFIAFYPDQTKEFVFTKISPLINSAAHRDYLFKHPTDKIENSELSRRGPPNLA